MTVNGAVWAADAQALCALNEAMDHLSIDTTVYTNSKSLSDAVASNKFDSVVLDIDNPRALEVLRLIRGSDRNSEAMVLAVVSNSESARAALQAGANFVLHKPVVPALATSCIRSGYPRIFRSRRRYPRVNVQLPATVAYLRHKVSGTILDLSKGGLAIRCDGKLPMNEIMTISFKLRGEKVISATGVLAWCGADRTAGFRFTYVPDDDAKRLGHWLAKASLGSNIP